MNSYTIISQLSTTLQGAIYKAIDNRSKQQVAIKVASKKRIQSCKLNENIQSEIALLKQLQRPSGIIRMLDSFEDSNNIYMVMEFAENGDLFSQLQKLQIFDEETAKSYFREIVQSIAELHRQNVCHLDISLENILIAKGGQLKVCDFGVAKSNCTSGKKVSSSGRPGKLMYMSPEVSSAQEFDPFKADSYSLGILLFCMLFGFNPYNQEATMKFRKFQGFCHNNLMVDEYLDHLQSSAVPVDDLCYAAILADDAEMIFDFHGVRDEVSSSVKDLIISLLCLEDQRISVQEILQHPWLSL